MTTTLFLQRVVELGLSIFYLDLLTIGIVNDMYIENMKYKKVATQNNFDNFLEKKQIYL